jgi:conjugal transfer/entry exclusion protein
MADPFSIVVSVAGLVGLTIQVTDQITTLVADLKDAPDSINGLKNELQSLGNIFQQLRDTLKDPFEDRPPFSDPVAASFKASLDNCATTLQRLASLMNQFNINAQSGRLEVFISNVKYVFKEQGILKIQRSLEAYKATLSISLLMMLMQVSLCSSFRYSRR